MIAGTNVRVGIVGCGFIGGRHADALARVDGVEIAALYDADAAKAAALAAKIGEKSAADRSPAAPRVVDSVPELLSIVDALYICLPPFAHTNEVELAAKAGVHVFIEKPIALSSDSAAAMVDHAERAGIVAQVGYMMRFAGAVQRIHSLINDGTAGRPTLYQATYACNSLHTPWWRDRAKSGGQLFEQAIHIYDLALFFLGRPATVACAMDNLCHRDVDGYTAEDTSSSVIRFADGPIASIAATNCAVPGEWNHRFTLTCERMVATVTNGTALEIVFTHPDVRREEHVHDDDVFLAEDAAFIESVREGVTSPVPMRVGLDGVRLVEAATRAAQTGTVAKL